MRTRALRLLVLAILIGSALAAGGFLYDIDRQERDVLDSKDALDVRLARIDNSLAAIGAAQQSYLAPGQQAEPWFERMSSSVQQLYDEMVAVRAAARSPEAAARLDAITASMEALLAADTRARENLRLSQPFMAADVIFSDGRNALDALTGFVRELRDAERASYRKALASLDRDRSTVLAAVALIWLLGAIVLVVPERRTAVAAGASTSEPPAAPRVAETPEAVPSALDLGAAAALCTALSRITTTAALAQLLERTADILDASGIILWLGAGEELFAVTSHGYSADMIARLGPLSRRHPSATASAWREGRMVTVAADGTDSGAVVAPLFGPDTCIGVLAIELRHGRERDAATQAVAAMVAAQLGSVVSAWPAPSAATPATAASTASDQPAREASGYR